MKTVLECLESGTGYLQKHEITSPRRNMEWMVAHLLGCTRIELYTQFDRPLSEDHLAPLRDLLKRRGQHEPLQHLLGTVEFFGREFTCDKRALIPRPESEELVEETLKLDLTRPAHLLDMGTGSGVLGISIALSLGSECQSATLADSSNDALTLARENLARHGLDVQLLESDLFSRVEGTFDLIVANLPYVAETDRETLAAELTYDPPQALFAGQDGLDLFRRFLPRVPGYLRPGGWLALEIGSSQGDSVTTLVESSGLREIRLSKDLSGNPRFVFAQMASDPETVPTSQ